MDCGVYLIRNTVNQKVYVGSASSIKTRWARHIKQLTRGMHDNPKLQNAWDKHGAEAFKFEVVVYCPRYSLFPLEQATIDALDAVNSGYNIAKVAGSSMSGRTHSEATKRLMSEERRGKKQPKEWVDKRAARLRGHSMPQAQKDRISAALKNRPASEGTAANLRRMAANFTPEYISWLGRKGAASRWGRRFIDPKPVQCFYKEQLPTPSNERAALAA
jgi:group I intron endonuclease